MKRRIGIIVFILTLPALAAVKTEMIEYKDGGTVLEGMLAYDDSSTEKRPGVLVVHEWWGLNDHAKTSARRLAEEGFVAFAADIYGKGVKTDDPAVAGNLSGEFRTDREKLRRRAKAGLDVLRSFQFTDPAKLAAIGYCFGGMTVLELARSGEPMQGVVSFHGALNSPAPAVAGNIKARVLICHGADDPFVPDEEVAAFKREMDEAKADYAFKAYAGAQHSFTNPDVDRHKLDGAKYNAAADKQSWADMKAFFEEIFK
ncbi:MAG: hypothetical protein AMXMBFR4_21560 [Candidatus Hydrogenedentota bacterium]